MQNVNLSLEITRLKDELKDVKEDQERSKKQSSKKLELAVQESKSKQNLINEQNKNLEYELEVGIYTLSLSYLTLFLMCFYDECTDRGYLNTLSNDPN